MRTMAWVDVSDSCVTPYKASTVKAWINTSEMVDFVMTISSSFAPRTIQVKLMASGLSSDDTVSFRKRLLKDFAAKIR